MPRAVVLAGCTGLVGREILKQLAADETVGRVTALVRRPLERPLAAKVGEGVVDFDRLGAAKAHVVGDQLFSALGTTIKAAGSQRAFRKVDYDYPLQLATMARAAGVRHFLLVSALGADPGSRVFYSRVKGELEEAVGKLGFPSLTVARPSLLVGERSDPRRGEEVAKHLAFLTPRRWKPVHASQVAAALVQAARDDRPGTRVLENDVLLDFPRS